MNAVRPDTERSPSRRKIAQEPVRRAGLFRNGFRSGVVWKSRAEPYLAPLLVVLTVAYALSVKAPWVEQGYWAAVSGSVGELLFTVAPLGALAASWQGARWRRAGLDRWPTTRPTWQIMFADLWPTLLLAAVGLGAALAALAPAAIGAPGGPDPALFVLYLLVLTAHTSVGYLLGRSLPQAVALPLAPFSSFLWLGYLGAIEPLWVRHLSGAYVGSPTLDLVPSEPAVLAAGLLAAAVILGAFLWLVGAAATPGPGTRVARGSAVAIVAAVAVVSSVLVSGLGPDAVRARTGPVDCAGTAPEICLWPEQRAAEASIRPDLVEGYRALIAAGLELPSRITVLTEDRATPVGTARALTGDVLVIWLPAAPERQQAPIALAQALIPLGPPACSANQEFPGYAAYGPVFAWAALAAGAEESTVSVQIDPSELDVVRQVRALPAEAQVDWFTLNRRALFDCTTHPVLDAAQFDSRGTRR